MASLATGVLRFPLLLASMRRAVGSGGSSEGGPRRNSECCLCCRQLGGERGRKWSLKAGPCSRRGRER
jgi:hypothetical protein